MATIIEINAALQTIQNLAGLQRDMVHNAKTHKTLAQAASPIGPLAQVVRDCAAAYLTRIGWVESIVDDPGKVNTLTNGLLAVNGTLANANASKNVLKSAALNLQAAGVTLATHAEVIGACDALLAAVPEPIMVF